PDGCPNDAIGRERWLSGAVEIGNHRGRTLLDERLRPTADCSRDASVTSECAGVVADYAHVRTSLSNAAGSLGAGCSSTATPPGHVAPPWRVAPCRQVADGNLT